MYNSRSQACKDIFVFLDQASPSSGRIQKISEKLSTIQIGVENERFQKLEQAEQRIQQAEDAFNEFQEQIFTKLNGLRDQLGKLQKQVEEDKLAKEQANETKNREVSALQKKFENAIDNESQTRKEGESKVLRLTEDKTALLRTEVQKETAARVDAIEGIHQGLQNDLPKIQEAIRNEANERDEADQNVMKSITDELVKLSNLINVEKRNRDESEQSIFEMLKDIVNRVKVELDQEKKTRFYIFQVQGNIRGTSPKFARRYLQQVEHCSKSMIIIKYIKYVKRSCNIYYLNKRSISAHESILKYSKLLTQRNQNYVKPFWPQNDFYDKESLYILNKSLKEEINQIKQENIKLKTKLIQYEVIVLIFQKDFVGYERYLEEISKQQKTNAHKNQELLLAQLKKQNKDLTQNLEEKIHTIEQMKKSVKVTRVQEIEVENIVCKEEVLALKKLLMDQEKSTKDQLMQTVVVQENFQKTQQGFIKQQKEINDLKLKQQQDQKQIKSLQVSVSQYQIEIERISSEKKALEEKLKKTAIEVKQKSSTNSFRSNKFQATTEVSCTQLKTKYQDELQYKLIIRGITYDQFFQMISELKQQADDMKKQITKEDIEYILAQEPFVLSQERVQDVIKSLSGTGQKLADSLLNQIGKYKTFFDYPQFNLQEAENQITQTLKSNDLTPYLTSLQLKKWTKEDVLQFISKMKFDWSESTKLFYLLNLFEKSGQVLEFDENTILNPFPSLESSRIVEESDEDLFDQKSDQDSQRVIIEDHDEYIT